MVEMNMQRYHLDNDCNEKFTDLIRELNKDHSYVLICIPKYPDEKIVVIKNGERLGHNNIDLRETLSAIFGETPIKRAQYPAEIGLSNINRATLRLDDAICSWERTVGREYTFLLAVETGQKWVVYASQSGKPTFPLDFEWGEILRFGLGLRAKNP